MRNPNGYGGIRKLSGNRRRPFQVRLTEGWENINGIKRQKFITLGYYETRQKALIALAEYNKSPCDLNSIQTTFEEIYDTLYKRSFSKMSKSSKGSYQAAYKKCAPLHKLKITEIRMPQLQKLFDSNSHMSSSTQNNMKILISVIFKYCLEYDIIQTDYSQYIKFTAAQRKIKRRPFSPDEIKLLKGNLHYYFDTGKAKISSGQWVDTILILLYTGVRINEMLGIKCDQISLKNKTIDIHGTKNEASRRTVPIHDEIFPFIERRFNEQTSEYLLTTKTGARIPYAVYINNIFLPAMNHFKMNHLSHDCRHTFATYARKNAMDSLIIKRILGHTSQDITEDVYTHTIDEMLNEEIKKLVY